MARVVPRHSEELVWGTYSVSFLKGGFLCGVHTHHNFRFKA